MQNYRTVLDRRVSIPNYSQSWVNHNRQKWILSSSKHDVQTASFRGTK